MDLETLKDINNILLLKICNRFP